MKISLLKSIPLFGCMSEDVLTTLSSFSSLLKLEKGATLFYEGDKGEKLTLIVEGKIQVYKTDPKGNRVILHTFSKDDMVGEMALFQNICYPATACALTDAKVLSIDFHSFETKVLGEPSIAMMMIRSLNQKIRHLEGVISRNTTMSAKQRVIDFLIREEKKLSSYRQHEVAQLLHMVPETMSRVLKELKNQGLISTDWKSLVLLDKAKLKEFLEEGSD